jgi:hypothetical protein
VSPITCDPLRRFQFQPGECGGREDIFVFISLRFSVTLISGWALWNAVVWIFACRVEWDHKIRQDIPEYMCRVTSTASVCALVWAKASRTFLCNKTSNFSLGYILTSYFVSHKHNLHRGLKPGQFWGGGCYKFCYFNLFIETNNCDPGTVLLWFIAYELQNHPLLASNPGHSEILN